MDSSEDNVVSVETLEWIPPAEGQGHGTLRAPAPEDQQLCPDFLRSPQPQQLSTLIKSSLTGAEGGGRSATASPLVTEPIPCSMMPFDNGSQNGQLFLVKSEPGPVTSEKAPVHGIYSFCQGEVVPTLPLDCGADHELVLLNTGQNVNNKYRAFLVWGNGNQVDQTVYHQAACPSDYRGTTADRRHQTFVSQTFRTSRAPRSHKPCHCTKSKCLKLYCECFASGIKCNNCKCTNCHNNPKHEAKPGNAMRSCLVRNPDASLPKIYKGKSGALEGQHNKGCNCKRSGCLKNYCVCYEANISCTFSCKCVDCKNCVADLADKTFSGNARGRGPVPVITPGVVEAVVGCLLVLAEEAEWEQRCEAWAQHVLLNEFGHCLTQIVNAMFKTYAQ